MNLNHLAFRVKTIEAIPKNESGKTLYTALEKFYD
jgi:acyl-coenzyme A synthetase/AMP-(fatty) acid ligase